MGTFTIECPTPIQAQCGIKARDLSPGWDGYVMPYRDRQEQVVVGTPSDDDTAWLEELVKVEKLVAEALLCAGNMCDHETSPLYGKLRLATTLLGMLCGVWAKNKVAHRNNSVAVKAPIEGSPKVGSRWWDCNSAVVVVRSVEEHYGATYVNYTWRDGRVGYTILDHWHEANGKPNFIPVEW